MNSSRRLVYDFVALPHVIKIKILIDLGVYNKNEDSLPESIRYANYLIRISNRNLIPSLREKIDEEMQILQK
jgi:hypothetical protein